MTILTVTMLYMIKVYDKERQLLYYERREEQFKIEMLCAMAGSAHAQEGFRWPCCSALSKL
jgi:hypothetical protein